MHSEFAKQAHYENERKSTVIAFLLWFILGSWGAHNFYLDRDVQAWAQLALFVLGFFSSGLTWLPLVCWVLPEVFFLSGWVGRHNMRIMLRIDG